MLAANTKELSAQLSREFSEVTTECWKAGRPQDIKSDLHIIGPDLRQEKVIPTAKSIRKQSEAVPIIAIRPENSLPFKLALFDAGLDDYVRAPYHAGELLRRIRVFLKRTKRLEAYRPVTFKMADLLFDYHRGMPLERATFYRKRKDAARLSHAETTTEKKPMLQDFLASPRALARLQHLPLQDRIQFVQADISKVQLAEIKKILHFDYDLLSRLLLITERSLHLKKENLVFSPGVSDRIMAILELYSFGYEVMGGSADFHEWMRQPQEKLLGYSPLISIMTHPGLLAVRSALNNIQYGHL